MLVDEDRQPGPDGFKRKGVFSVLVGIDVTVAAIQVAAGQEVKKNIDGIFGKRNGCFHADL